MNTTLSTLWQRIKPTTQFDYELDETPAQLEADLARRSAYLAWISAFISLACVILTIIVTYRFLITKDPGTGIFMVGAYFVVLFAINSFRLARSKKIVQSIYGYGFGNLLLSGFLMLIFIPNFYKTVVPANFYIFLVLTTLLLPRREVTRGMLFNILVWFLSFGTAFLLRSFLDQIQTDPAIAQAFGAGGFIVPPFFALVILYQFRRISVLSKLMGTLSILTLALFVVVSSSAQNYAIQTVQANTNASLQSLTETQAGTISARLARQEKALTFVASQLTSADQNLEQYTSLLGEDAQLKLLDSDQQNDIAVAEGRIQIAVPAPNDLGTLAASYPASGLTSLLAQGELGETGEMDIYIPDQAALITSAGIVNLIADEVDELESLSQSNGQEVSYQDESVLGQSAEINGTNWLAVVHQHSSEINAPAIEQGRRVEFLLAMAVGLLWLALVWFSQVVAGPINQLRDVALKVRAGDLRARAKVEGTDEIGLLTGSFNRMTRQLGETLGGLEDRVSERTRDLEIASQVAQHITQALKLEELLPRLVEDTKDGFGLYSVSVFLYDPQLGQLLQAAGSGEAGPLVAQGFGLNLYPSLIAQAGRERKPVVIADVSQSEAFLSDPLRPETRSEAAIPMLAQGELVGVLDLQSQALDAFPEASQQILTTLAEQIAVAIRNARLYEDRVQATEKLRRIDLMKSQFLASMSHELRTPLNAIINFVEMVAVGMIGPVNTEQKELLEHSLQGSQHLLHLINDVLDISKIQAGQLHLFVEDNVDLNAELNTVVAMVQPLLAQKPLQLVRDIDDHLPLLSGDKRRIRQVLLNLLANAIKFTEKGTVTLSAKRRNGQVLFGVIDTGPGIPLESQTLIFEPFTQTEAGMRQTEGTGLGLPISRSLVNAHGGELWLESVPGEGSSFYFTLPVKG